MSLLLTQLAPPIAVIFDWYAEALQPYKLIARADYKALFEPLLPIEIPFSWYAEAQQPYKLIARADYKALFEPLLPIEIPFSWYAEAQQPIFRKISIGEYQAEFKPIFIPVIPPIIGGVFHLNPRLYRMIYYTQWS